MRTGALKPSEDLAMLAFCPPLSFSQVKMTSAPDSKWLLVPGGAGTREELKEEIAFIKAIHPKVRSPHTISTSDMH
jgi:hypothetical protein